MKRIGLGLLIALISIIGVSIKAWMATCGVGKCTVYTTGTIPLIGMGK